MFELDQDIAQEIVDQAMSILPHNVNVMDGQGLILGSGEPGRVLTRHEGAVLVLTGNRAVEIDAAAAKSMRGVECGVNLPLSIDGRVIGVVGVSGDPEQVRTYAGLVKMTAQMLLDQRFDREHRQWMVERNSSVVKSILFDPQLAGRTLVEAQRLGLNSQRPRSPVLIQFSSAGDQAAALPWLLRRYADSWCVDAPDLALVFCPPVAVDGLRKRLTAELVAQGRVPARVVFGPSLIPADALRPAVQRLTDLLSFATTKLPDLRELDVHTLRIPAALWRYRADESITDLLAPFELLVQADGNGVLRKTLRTWFENACDGHVCSEVLAIHRNSLRKRMDRIAVVTGLDPTRPDGMLTLYLGLMLSQD